MLDHRVVEIVGEVQYKRPDWGTGATTFPKVIAAGGKCGPRAWFGRFMCRAFGIPVWGVKQPGHAAVGYLGRGAKGERGAPYGWHTVYGGGWEKSRWNGRKGPEFIAEAAARSRATEYSQVVHLRWLAAALAPEEQAAAVRSVAAELLKQASEAGPALEPQLEDEAEAEKATKGDDTAGSAPRIPKAPRKPRPGVLHFEAESFSRMAGVAVHDCLTGGKQVYVELQKGKQTLKLTRPRPQRGVALRWLQLKAKE